MAWIRCMGGSGAKTVGTDKVPYLLRATPFDANLKKMKLVGGSVAFNQLVKNGNFADSSEWAAVSSTFSVSDNVVTIQPSAQNGRIGQVVSFPLGHKMLTILDFKGASGITYGFNNLVPTTNGTGDWVELSKIMESPVQSNQAYLFMAHQSNDGFSNPFYVKNVCLFDLTQMFGSTIADYIYSLEQGTAGAGVAFFRKLFANDYYAYNAGELMSVKPTAHEVVGKNIYDFDTLESRSTRISKEGEWYTFYGYWADLEFPVSGGGTNDINWGDKRLTLSLKGYCSNTSAERSGSNIGFLYSDGTNSTIILKSYVNPTEEQKNTSYTITSTAGKKVVGLRFSYHNNDKAYIKDVQIEFGTTATTYEPYKKYTYQLDGTKRVYRKYGIVDLGSLNYSKSSSGLFSVVISSAKPAVSVSRPANVLAGIYTTIDSLSITGPQGTTPSPNMVMAENQSRVFYFNNTSYTDPADFKTAMSGVYLIYELNSPFYETVTNPELRGLFKLDSNNKLYCDGDICDDIVSPMAMMSGGTEAFVDSRAVPVPVGHESTYYSVDFPE